MIKYIAETSIVFTMIIIVLIGLSINHLNNIKEKETIKYCESKCTNYNGSIGYSCAESCYKWRMKQWKEQK